MRLWSLHPKYLDAQGLVALWREGLLAQAVLAGKTRGYRNHPQLQRFRDSTASPGAIAEYLDQVQAEAARRGYRFDAKKIGRHRVVRRLPVPRGQLEYEWAHLRRKLRKRSPQWLKQLPRLQTPEAHPLFRTIEGGIADWDKPSTRGKSRPQTDKQ